MKIYLIALVLMALVLLLTVSGCSWFADNRVVVNSELEYRPEMFKLVLPYYNQFQKEIIAELAYQEYLKEAPAEVEYKKYLPKEKSNAVQER